MEHIIGWFSAYNCHTRFNKVGIKRCVLHLGNRVLYLVYAQRDITTI